MIIRELNLIHFGKFHNYHMELGPHMNIIAGINESGKTTIYTFIHAMLFGIRRARGRAAASDLYNRYQPWDTPGSFEGAINFEHEGKNYRLYRNFCKDDTSVSLICLENQKEISLVHGVIGDFIPGLTEENYKNTLGIPQAHSELDVQFAAAIQSQAVNMAMTGNQNLHLGRALEYLKKERKKIKADSRSDKIREINRDIQRLSAQLEHMEQTSIHFSSKDVSQGQGFSDESEEMGRLREASDLAKKAVSQCQMELGMMLEKERYLRDQINNVQEKIIFSEKDPSGASKRMSGILSAAGVLCVIAGILLGISVIFNYSRLPLWASIGSFVLCCLFFLLGMAGYISAVQSKKESGDSQKENKKESHLIQGYRVQLEEITHSCQLKRQEKIQLERKIEQLEIRMDQCRRNFQRALLEQEKYNETVNALEDCREQLHKFMEEERNLQKDDTCIVQAYHLLEELSGEIHESFGSFLWENASRFMEDITGNKRHFRVSKEFHISVDNSKIFVPLDRLSRATTEQFYLALRLSAAGLLFGSEHVPVVLDDTFAYYDDQRLSAVLFWLSSQQPNQIILLSCHHRECDLMDRMNIDYNYVNLNQ